MNRELTPESLGAPSANYALAMLSERPDTLLHSSGIGPVRPDGSVPEEIADQAGVVWATLVGLLDEAGLAVSDVVSVTTFVVVGDGADEDVSRDLATVMAARDAALNGHRCASTLVPVPRLATPSWRMEIAIVAAGPR